MTITKCDSVTVIVLFTNLIFCGLCYEIWY